MGSEFKGESLKMLKNHGCKVWESDAGEKTKQGIVERFNRTIRELLEKYLTINRTKKYMDYRDWETQPHPIQRH